MKNTIIIPIGPTLFNPPFQRLKEAMREIDHFDLFEQLNLLPYRAEDIFDMRQGDIYVVGSTSGQIRCDKKGMTQPFMIQALFTRTRGALSFEAFSTLKGKSGKNVPIKAIGKLRLSIKDQTLYLDDKNKSAFSDFMRVAEQLNLIRSILSDDENGLYVKYGFRPLFSGLWLNKHQQTVEPLSVMLDDDLFSVREYDFAENSVLIPIDAVDEHEVVSISSLKDRIVGPIH